MPHDPRWRAAATTVAAALLVLAAACTPEAVTPAPKTASPLAPSTLPEPTIPLADPSADPSAFAAQGGQVVGFSATVQATPIARPTPTPDPNVWRFEGIVVDEDGDPIAGVCVIIGPHGCRPGSIRTDGDGRYSVDMPQVPTIFYDFYFAKDGYQVVWYHANPKGPTVFNVVLKRS